MARTTPAWGVTEAQPASVTGEVRSRRVHVVAISAYVGEAVAADDEIVIELNGRAIKRLTGWQAERAGLTPRTT